MSAFLGNIQNFDSRTQDWQIFSKRVGQFLTLNSITAEDKKRAVLLTHLSDEVYKLLRNLAHPSEVETLSYSRLTELLDGHFTPKRSTFADLAEFYSAVQAEEESVEDWAARLRGLAIHCEFGTALDTLFLHRFVLGLKAGPERNKVFEQEVSKLTFKKALELAQQMACARQARNVAPPSMATPVVIKDEPLYRASTGRAGGSGATGQEYQARRCTVCGLKNHVAEKCRYKNYKCSKCNVKGHLKKVCDSKINRVHNIDMEPAAESEDCSDCKECQVFSMRCVNYDPILLDVIINGSKTLNMELDSGSSTSVIAEKLYKTHFSHLPLNKCNMKMCFYNGHKITPLGCFSVEVTYRNNTEQLVFFVVKDGGPPLLGRDFMTKFKIGFISYNNKINTGNFDDGEVLKLLNSYEDLFKDELGCFNKFEVNLQLKEGVKPKFCKARTLPFALKEHVEAELIRLVDKGILLPVNHSDYATPIVPVRKANGSVRICADYSVTLNNDIYVDKYPLPRIEEVFAKLSGGEQFSKLDCSQAYNQFRLSKESQKLTTINTTKGLFMYTRLVFGLASAPAIFQRAIENLLAGIDGVTVFLDDVCVTGPSKDIHLKRLRTVFQKFQEAGLRLEKSKCAFFQNSVTYLGHVIDKNGLRKCTKKVEAINSAPSPTNITELKRFIGMVNYYRNFVPNASSILSPLHELLRADARWEWAEKQQVAFERIKRELTSDRVLAHYNPNAQLVLTVDASPAGLGAVLTQAGTDGVERPLAFGSRSLTASERNYSQLHKEATAIIFGVKRFHQYLYGRQEPFILKTDHKPLLAIFGKKNGISVMTASRLVRYSIILSAYNYKIQYTSGKENLVADFFSRAPVSTELNESSTGYDDIESIELATVNSLQLDSLPLTYKDIQAATMNDQILRTVSKYIKYGWPRKIRCKNILPYFQCRNDLEMEKGCLFRGHRVVIPQLCRDRLLQELHKTHQGIVKTKSAARSRMWWPGIDKDIEQLIGSCPLCSALRAAPPRAPPSPWPRPAAPWERVHIDYMAIAQKSYLVVVDAYSKWLECLEMSGGITTKHLILKLKFLFCRYGLPKTIVSDNDTKISSHEFLEFCKINGIEYLTSPIYHPCSNGQAENSVKTCKKMLKCLLQNNSCPNKIPEKLQEYLFEYRNTVHCSTGMTPARLMLGRDLRSRLDLIVPPRVSKNSLSEEKNDNVSISKANGRIFNIGQKVWVKCFDNRKPYWSKGVIISKIGNRMYMVHLVDQGVKCRRHVDQLRRYCVDNKNELTDVTCATPNCGVSTSSSSHKSPTCSPRSISVIDGDIDISSSNEEHDSNNSDDEHSGNEFTGEDMTERSIMDGEELEGEEAEQAINTIPSMQPSANQTTAPLSGPPNSSLPYNLRPRNKKINYKD